MIFSGSRSGRRRRRSCRARSPNSCSSAIRATCGRSSTRPVAIGETVMASDAAPVDECGPAVDQLRLHAAALRRMSSSISRRPADSAAISTRPAKFSQECAQARAPALHCADRCADCGGGACAEVLVRQRLRQADRVRRATVRCGETAPRRCNSSATGMNTSAGSRIGRCGVVAALLVAALRFHERAASRVRPASTSTAIIVFAGR